MGGELVFREVYRHQRGHARDVERGRGLVHRVFGEGQADTQVFAEGGRHARLHLETHRLAEPTAAKLFLNAGEQVVGFVFLDLDVCVAGDPKHVRLTELHAREQGVQVGRDQLFDRQEPPSVLLTVVGEREQAGEHDDLG